MAAVGYKKVTCSKNSKALKKKTFFKCVWMHSTFYLKLLNQIIKYKLTAHFFSMTILSTLVESSQLGNTFCQPNGIFNFPRRWQLKQRSPGIRNLSGLKSIYVHSRLGPSYVSRVPEWKSWLLLAGLMRRLRYNPSLSNSATLRFVNFLS